MRCACIDIGSNTTRLLVADADPPGGPVREVASQRVFTRIGAACGPDGTIAGDKIDEVARVVAIQAEAARQAGATHMRAVGTAAIRRAPNAAELCAAVHAACGVVVDVLPGEDEARLAFLGATCGARGSGIDRDADSSDANAGPVAVVDVGGGSTEVVVGTVNGPVTWVVSLPVGSSVLGAGYDGPMPADRVLALLTEARGAFAGVVPPPVTRAIAVGGSATSVRLLVGEVLERGTIERALSLLTGAAGATVATELGLHPERVRMLPAGLAILAAASDALGGRPLEIGAGGLREGVVLDAVRGG